MAKINLEKFKSNAKSALSKKETHGIFKEQGEKLETIPLSSLEKGVVIRLFEKEPASLVRSIKEQGQLEPIIVRKKGERYEILDGYRRVAAAEKLGRADISAEVVEAEAEEAPFMPYILNAPESFDLIEVVHYLHRLKKEFGFDDETIEKRTGLKVADYRELFFETEGAEGVLDAFNRHFEGLLKRYFRVIHGELDIEKGGVRLKLRIDGQEADEATKAEIYRFIYRLSRL
ncbi:ParB/RepB/Spo0J family partition protein [Hydrogenimonas urashimensis]|uniref:ParB/RepB/Spo0J family partition protein n=1 Tax=Hydrogenimonas urashimensis TaxID=2740515 RepID=UPI0019158EA9|nr:ParB N-terminal domain-containing protein [Hydrogenimonas urashimensis]